jgi:hypothetical protein
MLTQDEHGIHENLHGSDRQSAMPYVYKESVVLLCVAMFKAKLNLFAPIIRPTFIAQGQTVTL